MEVAITQHNTSTNSKVRPRAAQNVSSITKTRCSHASLGISRPLAYLNFSSLGHEKRKDSKLFRGRLQPLRASGPLFSNSFTAWIVMVFQNIIYLFLESLFQNRYTYLEFPVLNSSILCRFKKVQLATERYYCFEGLEFQSSRSFWTSEFKRDTGIYRAQTT